MNKAKLKWVLVLSIIFVSTSCTTTKNLDIRYEYESLPKEYPVYSYSEEDLESMYGFTGVVVGTVDIKGFGGNYDEAARLARKYGANCIVAVGEYMDYGSFSLPDLAQDSYSGNLVSTGTSDVSYAVVSGTYVFYRTYELLNRYARTDDVFEGFYPDGTPWFRTEIRDGIPHGTHVEYASNGQILQDLVFKDGHIWEGLISDEVITISYVNGRKHGDGRSRLAGSEDEVPIRYENGILADSILYAWVGDDEEIPVGQSGEVRNDFPNDIYQISPYDEDGRLHGVQRFFISGDLVSETTYSHGITHGLLTYYTGNSKKTTPYVDGDRHGIEMDYDGDGEVYGETPYYWGRIHGVKWYGLYRDGTYLSYEEYLDGFLHNMPGTEMRNYYWIGMKVAPYPIPGS